MISCIEAKELIKQIKINKEIIELDIINALDYIVAEDVFSPISFPPFPQSAMDGYAISSLNVNNEYHLVNEIKAGDSAENIEIKENQTIRIFTGAMLPKATFAIVKQEDVLKEGEKIQITINPKEFENIRFAGEQTKTGQLILLKNSKINPGTIGFLAMLGISSIKVYKKPNILIVATGNELLLQNEVLAPGKIFESNTYTLKAALKQFGFDADAIIVKDDKSELLVQAEIALVNYDLILFTGGISVGDYDFVYDVLMKLDVKNVFYKVKQKPGKPLFFGTKGNKMIFALPGNPAAVLTSFYIYVLEALAIFKGEPNKILNTAFLKLKEPFSKTDKLTFFLKGKKHHDIVEILNDQSSAMLSSFVEADCLVVLPEGKSSFEKNEFVEIINIK